MRHQRVANSVSIEIRITDTGIRYWRKTTSADLIGTDFGGAHLWHIHPRTCQFTYTKFIYKCSIGQTESNGFH